MHEHYLASRDGRVRKTDAIGLRVAVACYLLFGVLDVVVLTDVWPRTVIVRSAIAVLALGALQVVLAHASSRRTIHALCALATAVGAIGWMVQTLQTELRELLPVYLSFGAIFMLGANLFFQFRLRTAFACSLSILAAFSIAIVHTADSAVLATVLISFLVSCFGFSFYLGWQIGLERYRTFLNELRAELNAQEATKHGRELLVRASTDSLTGLENRSAFQARIRAALGDTRGGQRSVALHLVDLDRFKNVNDSAGHAAGDAVLREAARRIGEAAGVHGHAARLGGDEFAVVQVSDDSSPSAVEMADRIVAALCRPFDGMPDIGASVGTAVGPVDAADAGTLYSCADLALYAAKDAGRGRHVRYRDTMAEAERERRELEDALDHAIERNEFVLYLQPRLSTQTGVLSGYEALLRWQHPDRGLIDPDVFIPVAEQSGQIVRIGAWVLTEACRLMVCHELEGRISVNVSARQFADGDLVANVEAAVSRANLCASRLELEITETTIVADHLAVRRMIDDLHRLGVRVALDDFGTGYASLSYLNRFPFDTIKIDRAFVAALGQKDSALPIVRAIIHLAQSLNMSVVAEGVETDEQLRTLASLGCEELQGFRIGRPSTVENTVRVASSSIFRIVRAVQFQRIDENIMTLRKITKLEGDDNEHNQCTGRYARLS